MPGSSANETAFGQKVKRPRALAAALVAAMFVVTGCSLPTADGTEAAIVAKAAGLPVLAAGKGNTAQNVVRRGLLLDPAVQAAASRVAASADEVRVQRAAIFPSLGLSIGGGIGDAGKGRGTAELVGRQLIMDFGNTKRAVTAADLDLQIDYIAFQQAVDQAMFDLLEAYDIVRKYVLLLDIRKQQYAAMQELHTLVADRTNSGAVSSSDLLEARKRLQATEFLVLDTSLALAESRDRLTRLSGQERGGKVPALNGTCVPASGSDDLRKARLELAKAELNLERAEKAQLPRVYVSPIVRNKASGGGFMLGLNLGVDSDLLQGGALSARTNAARNNREGANAGVAAADRNADLDVSKLKREITAAGRKSSMLRRQIDLLVETRELYRSQYFSLGTRQVSELLDNEEEYYNRKAELVELQSELTADRIDCAARDRSLRKAMGLDGNSLYGFPLAADAL